MTASGLRREAARGRLSIERIAGKDYTTLANIERMRKTCQLPPRALASTCDARDETRTAASSRDQSTSSSTTADISPQDALSTKLAKRKRA
jgi:hypothetical protein